MFTAKLRMKGTQKGSSLKAAVCLVKRALCDTAWRRVYIARFFFLLSFFLPISALDVFVVCERRGRSSARSPEADQVDRCVCYRTRSCSGRGSFHSGSSIIQQQLVKRRRLADTPGSCLAGASISVAHSRRVMHRSTGLLIYSHHIRWPFGKRRPLWPLSCAVLIPPPRLCVRVRESFVDSPVIGATVCRVAEKGRLSIWALGKSVCSIKRPHRAHCPPSFAAAN